MIGPFALHCFETPNGTDYRTTTSRTRDIAASSRDVASQPSGLGLHWCDLEAGANAQKLAWTFFYTDDNTWHGEDFEVAVT